MYRFVFAHRRNSPFSSFRYRFVYERVRRRGTTPCILSDGGRDSGGKSGRCACAPIKRPCGSAAGRIVCVRARAATAASRIRVYARVRVRVRARISLVVDRYTFFSYPGRRATDEKHTHVGVGASASHRSCSGFFFSSNLLSFFLLLRPLLLLFHRRLRPLLLRQHLFSSLTGRSVSSLCRVIYYIYIDGICIYLFTSIIISVRCARTRSRVCVFFPGLLKPDHYKYGVHALLSTQYSAGFSSVTTRCSFTSRTTLTHCVSTVYPRTYIIVLFFSI